MKTRAHSERGFALIICLWLVTVLSGTAVYFAHTVRLEIRAREAAVNGVLSRHALRAAETYFTQVLTVAGSDGELPDVESYLAEDVAVGDARFWVIGRARTEDDSDQLAFGLIDEASKVNINTATRDMLLAVPGITEEIAAAIVDWRDADGSPGEHGAEAETYSRRDPPYSPRNADFPSVFELRQVNGIDTDALFGRDRNLNGILDSWESGDLADVLGGTGRASEERGLLEYVTVWSRELNVREDGSERINVNSEQSSQQLRDLVTQKLSAEAVSKLPTATPGQGQGQGQVGSVASYNSLIEFFLAASFSVTEFAAIAGDLATVDDAYVPGLINVNTASEEVLACLPGVGQENAGKLVAYRLDHSEETQSVAWVTEVLTRENALQAGPHITTHSYQFSADIAAVGRQGAGYRRALIVLEVGAEDVRTIYRRERTDLGWALGADLREELNQ